MGLEVAPYVQDLVVSNPISGDDVNQGDDHIRLLKTTLKATFPGATKPMYTSAASAKSASFSVVAADESKTFMVDATAAAVVATLPTLVSGDHGWRCFFIKLDGVNTFHIAPASGSLYSGPALVARARRCIQGTLFGAYWSGSNWYIERCERTPIGTLLPNVGTTGVLQPGYEWPIGQTLSQVNYPEYWALVHGSGGVVDMRGRAPFARSNMGGSDNGILSAVPGTTLMGQAGAQTVTMVQGNLPSVNFTVSGSASVSGSCSGNTTGSYPGYSLDHTHSETVPSAAADHYEGSLYSALSRGSAGGTTGTASNGVGDHAHPFSGSSSGSGSISGTAASGGSSTPMANLPPLMIVNFLLVVE